MFLKKYQFFKITPWSAIVLNRMDPGSLSTFNTIRLALVPAA
jgi:hypothetical protein